MKIHTIQKSLALGLLLLMAAVTTTAQNIWKTDAMSVKAGETNVTIQLALQNKDAVTALQFDLALPTGLTLKSGNVTLNSDRSNGHELEVQKIEATGLYRFLLSETQNHALKDTTGTLISLPVTIGADFKGGTIGLTNVVMTDKKATSLSYSTQFGRISIAEKQKVTLTVSGLEQVVNPAKAAIITYTTIPEGLTMRVGYYKDAACKINADESARKTSGTFYVAFAYAGNDTLSALNDTVIMMVANKKDVYFSTEQSDILKASVLLQGQPLSASILSGGKALNASSNGTFVPGSFKWTNGNQFVTASGKYSATFYPEDAANYVTKALDVALTVTPVYQVFVSQPEKGSIVVTGQKSDNMYAAGQILKLKAIPAANYKFVEWSVGTDKTATETTWSVDKAATVSAVFAPITRTVTFSADTKGTLSVKAGEKTLVSGDAVMQGTELSITVTPNDNMKLSALKLNGTDFASGKYVVGTNNVVLNATFVQAENEYPVKAAATTNGTIRLYKEDGTAISSGTALKENANFKMIPLANAGYELSALWINGVSQTVPAVDNVYTGKMGNGGASVSATFAPVKYKLTLSGVANGNSFSVKSGETSLGNNAEVAYNSSLTIDELMVGDTYKFVSLVANGKRIEQFPATLTVNGDMNIVAKFEELTPIKDEYIINTLQSYNYNGQSKDFIIYTTQTHATDFKLSYKDQKGAIVNGKPIKGGLYDVMISRHKDDIYTTYTSDVDKFKQKLNIAKVKIAVTEAPTANEAGKKGKTTLYQDETNIQVESEGNNLLKFTYGVTDADKDNYEGTTYYLSTGIPVKLNTQNMLRSAEELNGYVRISNGGLPYNENAEIGAGAIIQVEAIPKPGYKFIGWKNRSETTPVMNVTVEVDMDANFIPEFEGKVSLNATLKTSSSDYDGRLKLMELATLIPDVQISGYSDADCTQPVDLLNAGDYFIRVYRPETDLEQEVNKILPYTIKKASISPSTIVVPQVSPVAEGQTLSEVQLLGGNAGSVAGTFSWDKPATVVKQGKNSNAVKFISADPNYQDADVSVEVEGLSATKATDPGVDPEPPVGPTDPEKPTSIEQIASESLIVVRDLTLEIHPQLPVDITIVNMNGKTLYKGEIANVTNIRVPQPGVYIVSFDREGMQTSRKINVQ